METKKENLEQKEKTILAKLTYISQYDSCVFSVSKRLNPLMYERLLKAGKKIKNEFPDGYQPLIEKEYKGFKFISLTAKPMPWLELSEKNLKKYYKIQFEAKTRTYKSVKRLQLHLTKFDESTAETEHKISEQSQALLDDFDLGL